MLHRVIAHTRHDTDIRAFVLYDRSGFPIFWQIKKHCLLVIIIKQKLGGKLYLDAWRFLGRNASRPGFVVSDIGLFYLPLNERIDLGCTLLSRDGPKPRIKVCMEADIFLPKSGVYAEYSELWIIPLLRVYSSVPSFTFLGYSLRLNQSPDMQLRAYDGALLQAIL